MRSFLLLIFCGAITRTAFYSLVVRTHWGLYDAQGKLLHQSKAEVAEPYDKRKVHSGLLAPRWPMPATAFTCWPGWPPLNTPGATPPSASACAGFTTRAGSYRPPPTTCSKATGWPQRPCSSLWPPAPMPGWPAKPPITCRWPPKPPPTWPRHCAGPRRPSNYHPATSTPAGCRLCACASRPWPPCKPSKSSKSSATESARP